jgi:hypothetical protein
MLSPSGRPRIVSYLLFPDWPSTGFWQVIFPQKNPYLTRFSHPQAEPKEFFAVGKKTLLPGPARTPGSLEPKRLGRKPATPPPKKIPEEVQKKFMYANYLTNFCQLLLKLGRYYEIWNGPHLGR